MALLVPVVLLAAGIFLPSEAKLEARCPPLGQMSLQGTWGGRKSAALFLLVPQDPSRGVKAASLGMQLGIPGGRSHLLEGPRLASTQEGPSLGFSPASHGHLAP